MTPGSQVGRGSHAETPNCLWVTETQHQKTMSCQGVVEESCTCARGEGTPYPGKRQLEAEKDSSW